MRDSNESGSVSCLVPGQRRQSMGESSPPSQSNIWEKNWPLTLATLSYRCRWKFASLPTFLKKYWSPGYRVLLPVCVYQGADADRLWRNATDVWEQANQCYTYGQDKNSWSFGMIDRILRSVTYRSPVLQARNIWASSSSMCSRLTGKQDNIIFSTLLSEPTMLLLNAAKETV